LAPIRTDAPAAYANRGLSGIDGTISTAIGLCLAAGRPGVLLCGDLAFTHDVGGLAIGPDEPRPDLRIVVADDSGGSIFATLEYGAPAFAEAFERVFATPTGLDPVVLAAGYGVPARRVAAEELDAALQAPIRGIEVVVVGLDRSGRAELDARLAAEPSAG
jgi:2-succinyl-5-enolpyruvyl-6-hydroxy-3-cyclohexene-1-carboxylate synthase